MDAFRIAYDGREFSGFQRQPDVPTVEDALLEALRTVGVLEADEDLPPGYAAAGRTDAGVSALGQVVAFEAPEWLRPAALNDGLPDSIRAWAHADAPPEFHAAHDASWRTYEYHLFAPGADLDRAREMLDRIEGVQDFQNFTPEKSNTSREIKDTSMRTEGDFLVVRVRGDSFCRHMVRRLVSLVEAVSTGQAPLSKVDRAFEPDPLPGPEAIETAPAEPLVLVAVEYPELKFEVDDRALEAARTAFRQRRIRHETAGRVAGSIETELENRGDGTD